MNLFVLWSGEDEIMTICMKIEYFSLFSDIRKSYTLLGATPEGILGEKSNEKKLHQNTIGLDAYASIYSQLRPRKELKLL